MERSLWKEEYRLGVKELDDDHIAICGLLERLLKAIDDKEKKPAISAIFGELHATLNEHFRDEEQYLLEAGCPEKNCKEHTNEHRDVLFTLNHEFSNWEKSFENQNQSTELSNLCRWVWLELITADMHMKKKLENIKEHR